MTHYMMLTESVEFHYAIKAIEASLKRLKKMPDTCWTGQIAIIEDVCADISYQNSKMLVWAQEMKSTTKPKADNETN